MTIGKDKGRILVAMPQILKTILEERAKKENRSLTNYIVTILQKHVEDHPD